MENFLPALLIIGGVIYKIYSEYQKEQEKARRRIPQTTPPSSPVVVEQRRPRPTPTKPTIPTIPKVERSGDILEDVKRARERRMAAAKKSNKTTVVPLLIDTVEEKEGTVPSFDLREAVIQSTILERPYQ